MSASECARDLSHWNVKRHLDGKERFSRCHVYHGVYEDGCEKDHGDISGLSDPDIALSRFGES